MKKEEILKEELLRMRQLMGINGSLYQKPIMEDKGGDGHKFGEGEKAPDPLQYKGGPKNPQYQKDFKHWQEHNPPAPSPKPRPPAPRPPAPRPPSPPASPPAPSPKKGTASTTGRESKAFSVPKKGTSSKKIGDGQFVLPMASIPKFGGGKFAKGPAKGPAKGTTKRGKKTKKTKKKEK